MSQLGSLTTNFKNMQTGSGWTNRETARYMLDALYSLRWADFPEINLDDYRLRDEDWKVDIDALEEKKLDLVEGMLKD